LKALNFNSIVFPLIGIGILNYPIEIVVKQMLESVVDFLNASNNHYQIYFAFNEKIEQTKKIFWDELQALMRKKHQNQASSSKDLSRCSWLFNLSTLFIIFKFKFKGFQVIYKNEPQLRKAINDIEFMLQNSYLIKEDIDHKSIIKQVN